MEVCSVGRRLPEAGVRQYMMWIMARGDALVQLDASEAASAGMFHKEIVTKRRIGYEEKK